MGLNGCPTSFNWLIGDEYAKFESGHFANLTADCAQAIPVGSSNCQAGSSTAELRFDGVNYTRLPRVVAFDNIPDRASGNDTMVILNRLTGNLGVGMDKLGPLFGILYDDAENGLSFTFNPNTCQFRNSLSNNFPRTAPRFETAIPAGRSGWIRLFSQEGYPINGALLNRNTNANSNSNAFNGGHNTHQLKAAESGTMTLPVFPPAC